MEFDCLSLWSKVKERLITKMDADTFERYLAGIVPVNYDAAEKILTLGVLNDFVALWLDSNYKSIISETLIDLVNKKITVCFEAGHQLDYGETVKKNGEIPKKNVEPPEAKANEYQCPYRPDFTFDSFVVGSNTRICHAAAMAVCNNPGKAYNPLFIYGGVGLGKTHLLQAIANHLVNRRKRLKVNYLTSEEFVNLYVEAMQKKSLPIFRKQLRSLDVLIIDDVQFFEGKVGSSEEFFHTFNTLHNNHKQMVLASDRNPQEIVGMEQRLVSRFEWGLSAEILPPDIETRVAILKKKQENQKIKFSDEILFLIASKIQSNIRNLESALTKLIMNFSAFEYEITTERVEELLRDKFESETARSPTIETIQKKVAEYYDIRLADMTSKKRPQNIAFPRMIAMYFSRKMTNHSLPAIGEAFNRNHATILHAIDTIEKKQKESDNFRTSINQLQRLIRA